MPDQRPSAHRRWVPVAVGLAAVSAPAAEESAEAPEAVWDQDLLAARLRELGLDPTRWLPVSG